MAPPFRTLHERYPVENLEEPLAEGIISGHPSMPNSSSIQVKSQTSGTPIGRNALGFAALSRHQSAAA
jgi:hypothetical protein